MRREGCKKAPSPNRNLKPWFRPAPLRLRPWCGAKAWRIGPARGSLRSASPTAGEPPLPGATAETENVGAAITGPTLVCAECGRTVPAADTVDLQGRTICAACKPRVVQRMVEGAEPPPGFFRVDEFVAGIRAQGEFRVHIGSTISRGFDLVKANFWPCVGNSALVYLLLLAVGSLPCGIGLIGQMVLAGPLQGGLFMFMLLQVRGQPATINDTLSGFRQPLFKELMLASLVVQLLPIVAMFLLMAPVVIGMQAAINAHDLRALPGWMIPVFLLWIPLMAYYYAITVPCYLIIADTHLPFWDGIKLGVKLVHMRLLSFLGFVIVCWLLMMAGILMLCVGFLWMLPVVAAACAFLWSDIRQVGEAGRAAADGLSRS